MKRLVSSILLLLVLSLPVRAAEPRITNIEGLVAHNGQPAETDTVLSRNDVLRTFDSDTSYVDVTVPGGHRIRFRGAKVSFDSVGDQLTLELDRGKAFPAIDFDDEVGRRFSIKTPHAIMGVRGTKFFVKVTEEQTYTCVCEGTVSMKRRGFWRSSIGPSVSVPAGYDLHFFGDKTLSPSEPSPGMVTRTWNEFARMGYEVPETYRDRLDGVSSP